MASPEDIPSDTLDGNRANNGRQAPTRRRDPRQLDHRNTPDSPEVRAILSRSQAASGHIRIADISVPAASRTTSRIIPTDAHVVTGCQNPTAEVEGGECLALGALRARPGNQHRAVGIEHHVWRRLRLTVVLRWLDHTV